MKLNNKKIISALCCLIYSSFLYAAPAQVVTDSPTADSTEAPVATQAPIATEVPKNDNNGSYENTPVNDSSVNPDTGTTNDTESTTEPSSDIPTSPKSTPTAHVPPPTPTPFISQGPCEGKTGKDLTKCECGNDPYPYVGHGAVNACICNNLHKGNGVEINKCLCHLNAQSGDLIGTIGQCIAADVCPIISPNRDCQTGTKCCQEVVCNDKCSGIRPKSKQKSCFDKCMKQNGYGSAKQTSNKSKPTNKPKKQSTPKPKPKSVQSY